MVNITVEGLPLSFRKSPRSSNLELWARNYDLINRGWKLRFVCKMWFLYQYAKLDHEAKSASNASKYPISDPKSNWKQVWNCINVVCPIALNEKLDIFHFCYKRALAFTQVVLYFTKTNSICCCKIRKHCKFSKRLEEAYIALSSFHLQHIQNLHHCFSNKNPKQRLK